MIAPNKGDAEVRFGTTSEGQSKSNSGSLSGSTGMSQVNSSGTAGGATGFRLGDELRGERATMGKTLLDVQRDLRIRAAYIAAIEDARAEIFPNPSFIPGYVRSYARYLGLDAEQVYKRFCAESGFVAGQGLNRAAGRKAAPAPKGVFTPDFPLAPRRVSSLESVSFSAIGSLVVLIALVAGLGYGGWTVLQNIQRVQFAPVEDVPLAAADVDPLTPQDSQGPAAPALDDLGSPVAATELAELYRQQELEVPILMPRDGPIASIRPDGLTLVTAQAEAPAPPLVTAGLLDKLVAAAVAQSVGADGAPSPPEALSLSVVAERAAWVRVYLEDGTIIFERILETGESYSPPKDSNAPLVWAGNAGSVYVRVGEDLHGPLGSGTRAVRDVKLEPKAILERFSVVKDVPEAISRATAKPMERAEAAIPVQ